MDSPSLLVDLYELTMSQCYFDARKGYAATFDLFVREMPVNRSFLVAAGLSDVLEYARALRFTKEDISYLRSLKLFSGPFLDFLKDLRFTGDIWAMPEGTVFFANEPIVRVTAGIIEAQILESCLLNTVNVQTMIASKAARVALAAEGRPVYDFSLRRTHGSDAAMKAARSAYIAGCAGTSNTRAGRRYGIPVAGTMAHSFVMSFPSEREAFDAYCAEFPDKSVLLVDTYDSAGGIRNAIESAKSLRRRGHRLLGIRLDSGDLVQLSRLARKMLDGAGFKDVKIMVSGNLDEFSIRRIVEGRAPVDSFGVGTHMGASVDAPSLDCIYKLSEISEEGEKFLPAMKLSRGKLTYPGRKQVRRLKDRRGMFRRDIVGLEDEALAGTPLLEKVMEKGKRIRPEPSLEETRKLAEISLSAFSPRFKRAGPVCRYEPGISRRLAGLTRRLRDRLAGRQGMNSPESVL